MKSLSHVRLLATPWTAAYPAPPSMGFSRQESWSGVLLPSQSVKPSFSLIFLHMSTIIAHYLGLRSPGFQYSRPSHSTNKSPHQIAINNVLAHSHILFSWSLNTLLPKRIPLSAREMKPGGNFKLDFSVWFQTTPKQPQMLKSCWTALDLLKNKNNSNLTFFFLSWNNKHLKF